jgi:hypothetical protein
MIELRQQGTPVPVKYFLDKKEIFLLASYQQDVQQGGPGLCRGCQRIPLLTLSTSESFSRAVSFEGDLATIEMKKESQIGDESSSELTRQFSASKMLVSPSGERSGGLSSR